MFVFGVYRQKNIIKFKTEKRKERLCIFVIDIFFKSVLIFSWFLDHLCLLVRRTYQRKFLIILPHKKLCGSIIDVEILSVVPKKILIILPYNFYVVV